uniref:Uncharacterized protein n=1 Tax=viral metagenome TaxID=1070528 RepID=A0A6H1ZBF6_9ZZZZ
MDAPNDELKARRLRLKDWLFLEETRERIAKAAGRGDYIEVNVGVSAYISAAFIEDDWTVKPWFKVMLAFQKVYLKNTPTIPFPVLRGKVENKESPSWDYPGRAWYFWANLFAATYGWSLEVIAQMDIDDALGLFQEIMIDQQLQHEWEWSTTEMAFPYNAITKKSEFKPLTRPSWMLPITPALKKVKIRRDLMPMGKIVSLDGSEVTEPG